MMDNLERALKIVKLHVQSVLDTGPVEMQENLDETLADSDISEIDNHIKDICDGILDFLDRM